MSSCFAVQIGTLAKRLGEWGARLRNVEQRVAPGVLVSV